MKAEGMTFTKEELEGRYGSLARPPARQQGAVAILPVFGIIGQRMNLISEFSGGTSTEKLGKQIDFAANDPGIKAIVLDVDSPGGTVQGTPELSKKIFEARKKKHIVAVANSLMASAAYHLSSAADEIVVTPSGQVGSIGVYAAHQDVSKMHENIGVKMTLISAGEFKTEGNSFEPLSETARDSIQSVVNFYMDLFVSDVAKNRGVSKSKVEKDFGRGRTMTSADALNAGMVDRIETLEQTLSRLGVTKGQAVRIRADKEDKQINEGRTESDLNENEEITIDDEPSTREDQDAATEKKFNYKLAKQKLKQLTV